MFVQAFRLALFKAKVAEPPIGLASATTLFTVPPVPFVVAIEIKTFWLRSAVGEWFHRQSER